ncbi:hypothetical protein I603_2737 [Erythrobacter dokdonensis DSW-74]|uniref:Uncharacterized protein n=1 Tax=Erythrobacter dokdonensis DSW-74 TaxID=1300349 RepID=A0A1A7BDL3_9SPHN|nr:hypothetical protein I603_2737 [Erythrobacter dokdonensis DSW-74]
MGELFVILGYKRNLNHTAPNLRAKTISALLGAEVPRV